MKADPTFWILARASGLTAYLLLTTSVLAGLLVKARPFGKAINPAKATDIHRFLTLLGLGALSIHGLALLLDRSVHIRVVDLLVPGLAPYRPLWTGAGVLAAELMVVIVASFSLRRRIGARNWRRLHYLTFAIFAAATVHGIAAGTDSSKTWALALYLVAVGAVVAATVWRVLVPPARPVSATPRPAIEKQGGNHDERVPYRDRSVAV